MSNHEYEKTRKIRLDLGNTGKIFYLIQGFHMLKLSKLNYVKLILSEKTISQINKKKYE